MEDLIGKQFGAYQIISPFGQGGMATVYKAYQPSVDRFVAIKVLPRFHSSDPEFLGRFAQEAKSLAKLQHPHILPVYDFGESEGYTYFVMPLMQGGTLADLLTAERLSLDRVNQIISQVGSALDFAHAQGIIHRDVKPNNVLLDKSGNCILMDFGIAKIVEGSLAFTLTGGIIGTPAYMSPEQGSGLKIDHKSDIYSLGVILYEMVTGRPPYEAETPIAVIFKHVHDPLPPPSSFNPEISEEVERVILKSLAKDPGDRYESAREMVDALSRAVIASRQRVPAGVGLDPTVRKSDLDHPTPAAPALYDQDMMADESPELVQPVSRIAVGKERAIDAKPNYRRIALAAGFVFVVVTIICLVARLISFLDTSPASVIDQTPTPTETVGTAISTDSPMASTIPAATATPTLLVTNPSESDLLDTPALTTTNTSAPISTTNPSLTVTIPKPPTSTTIPILTATIPKPPSSTPTVKVTPTLTTTKPPTAPPTYPDLIVSKLTHSPLKPTTKDTIIFTATVTNVGDGKAGPSNLVFKIGGESSPPSFAIPSLAPGQSHSVQRKEILSKPMDYQITATADATNLVKESNERNNVAKDTVTVR